MSIGEKMFGGAVKAGTLLGFASGLVEANSQLKKVPETTVEVPAYEKPIYDKVLVGTEKTVDYGGDYKDYYDSDGDGWDDAYVTKYREPSEVTHSVYADYPRKYENGSLVTETVPSVKLTQRGVGSIVEEKIPIKEPSSINETVRNVIDGYETDIDVDYKEIGSYTKYSAKFDTGVHVGAILIKHTFAGLLLGCLGGAFITAVLPSDL